MVRDEIVEAERRPAERVASDADLHDWSDRDPYPTENGTGEPVVIPVIEERLDIRKQRRETARVRVRKSVETEERTVEDTVVDQAYEIEHVPVNRVVTEPVEPRYEGDTLVLPVLEEVLVVEKRLMLREEVRITRKRNERRTPQTHTVRREHVHVERTHSE
jgi:uncharacterized protein (TIGR02271 family)